MKLQSQDIKQQVAGIAHKLLRYRVLIFILLIGSVYAYMLVTISSLSNIQPSSNNVNGELSAIRTPKLDQSVVKQLEALRDNSVSVKTLFQNTRDNPFHE